MSICVFLLALFFYIHILSISYFFTILYMTLHNYDSAFSLVKTNWKTKAIIQESGQDVKLYIEDDVLCGELSRNDWYPYVTFEGSNINFEI